MDYYDENESDYEFLKKGLAYVFNSSMYLMFFYIFYFINGSSIYL